jgi:hypothetical protein
LHRFDVQVIHKDQGFAGVTILVFARVIFALTLLSSASASAIAADRPRLKSPCEMSLMKHNSANIISDQVAQKANLKLADLQSRHFSIRGNLKSSQTLIFLPGGPGLGFEYLPESFESLEVDFCLASGNPVNFAVFASFLIFTIWRIFLEERFLLACSPTYEAYSHRVRRRLLPLIY